MTVDGAGLLSRFYRKGFLLWLFGFACLRYSEAVYCGGVLFARMFNSRNMFFLKAV